MKSLKMHPRYVIDCGTVVDLDDPNPGMVYVKVIAPRSSFPEGTYAIEYHNSTFHIERWNQKSSDFPIVGNVYEVDAGWFQGIDITERYLAREKLDKREDELYYKAKAEYYSLKAEMNDPETGDQKQFLRDSRKEKNALSRLYVIAEESKNSK